MRLRLRRTRASVTVSTGRTLVAGITACVVVLGIGAAGFVDSDSAVAAPAVAAAGAPNIIVISTDDQAAYDLRWMPHTRRLIGGHGVTFTSGLSPHSLCCPARASMLTGQYAQNHGVRHNNGPRGAYQALADPDNTIARWLQDAGYRTAVVGKYMNGMGPGTARPEGWDRWNPFLGVTDFTTTTFANDGDPVVRTGHVDDVTNAYARDYVEEFSGDQPFFLWVSNYAPHRAQNRPGWEEYGYPAERHQQVLRHVKAPALSKQSFNERGVADQPPSSRRPKVSASEMQLRFTTRIASLQAADEGVRDLVATLAANGELDSTYIFFVSDNGYLLGEHRVTHKNYIFREAMEIPFAVRVPDAVGTTRSRAPVTLVDLAPTIADLAGAEPERVVDGASFTRVLRGARQRWRDTQLIQTGRSGASHGSWGIRGVRTSRYTYGKHAVSGFEQLYDRRRVPSEVRNVALDPAYRVVRRELRQRTRALVGCAGQGCVTSFGRVPRPRLG